MHYATFQMAHLTLKKNIMTFRSTISFSGSCYSPFEVLGQISEEMQLSIPPPQYTNTKTICSVLKLSSSLVYQIRLF